VFAGGCDAFGPGLPRRPGEVLHDVSCQAAAGRDASPLATPDGSVM
jgi:hypothetical protein